MLNVDQHYAYKIVTDCVLKENSAFFFVSGYGGTGKTFIVTVPSSDVVSLLLLDGRTVHSRFRIPLPINDTTLCDIKDICTYLSNLSKETSITIWDEALMMNRCFKALDRTLRGVLSDDSPLLCEYSVWWYGCSFR